MPLKMDDVEQVVNFGGNAWWLWVIKGLLALAAVVILAIRSLDRVHAGEMALRTTFGAIKYHREPADPDMLWGLALLTHFKRRFDMTSPIVIGPGLHVLNPLAHNLIKIDVRERTRRMKRQVCRTRTGHMNLYPFATFKPVPKRLDLVHNTHQDVDLQITILAEQRLRQMVDRRMAIAAIEDNLCGDIQDEADRYGMEMLKLYIATTEPTAASQLAVAFSDTGLWLRLIPGLKRARRILNLDNPQRELAPA